MAQNRLSGINPQAYQGVEASSPPQFVYFKKDPTPRDYFNFNIGTIWLNTDATPQRVWILVDLANHVATWIELLSGAGGAVQFQTADGLLAFPDVNGTLFVPGGTLITTKTAPNVNSVEIDITNGGQGQLIVGQGANPPVWGDLTSDGGTIIIDRNPVGHPGTINLEAAGAPGVTTYVEDVGNATAVADTLNIFGDGVNITTSGAGNTVTITLVNPGAVTTYHEDVGNAVPAAGILNILGDGVNITTAGAGNTVTISLAAPIVPFRSNFSYDHPGVQLHPGTGDGTVVTVTFPNRIYDLNNDFDGVSTFTAPRTGIYFFRAQVLIMFPFDRTAYLQTFIVTPTQNFVSNTTNVTNLIVAHTHYTATQDAIISLMVGDTVQFKFSISGGARDTTYSSLNSDYDCIFSGFLIS